MKNNIKQIHNIQINTDVGTFILIPKNDTTIDMAIETEYFVFSKNATIEATYKKRFTIDGYAKEWIFIRHEMEK